MKEITENNIILFRSFDNRVIPFYGNEKEYGIYEYGSQEYLNWGTIRIGKTPFLVRI